MCAIALATGLSVVGCDGNDPVDAGVDAGPPGDAGPLMLCPTENVPAPEELMGACCWRNDNSTQQDAPEYRLTYLEITQPAGTLSSITLRSVLNQSMQDETFSWLIRVGDAAADGPVTVTTGYGSRQTDGTYAFSAGAADGDPAAWCPVEIPATLTGDTLTSEALPGTVTIPIFDDTGTVLQFELALRNLSIQDSTWSEMRACIGTKARRAFTYIPAAQLTAFVEVEPARTQTISIATIETTVCSAVAGSLSDATFCDRPQAMWTTQPDSLCDATGCTKNTDGMTDVCDPDTTCNAWRVVGRFAAAGVDVTNSTCP